MATAKVLIADDDAEIREILADLLGSRKLAVVEASDGEEGWHLAQSESPDLAILDIAMPRLDGLQLLRRIRAATPGLPVVMLTASGDLRTAVEAMRLGAYHYLSKPFDPEELLLDVQRALDWRALQGEVDRLRRQVAEGGSLRELMGSSREIQAVLQRIRQVAGSALTVLIQGETGTGKELVARAIHQQSGRSARPFIAVDCGAIPETLIESELFGYEKGAFTGADRRKEGQFQLAEGGTLFLDEIVNLPPAMQAKLLRVIQERQIWPLGGRGSVPVEVRIIAACNVALEAEALGGRFRQDLFYRLNEFTISLPPLRSRRDDIATLAKRFLAEAGMEMKRPVRGFTDDAVSLLLAHPWPGNVRELRNAVRRAVLMSPGTIGPEHLDLAGGGDGGPSPEAVEAGAPLPTLKDARDRAAAEAERRVIRRALEIAKGNKSEAARLLQTDYKTLHIKIKQYDLRPSF